MDRGLGSTHSSAQPTKAQGVSLVASLSHHDRLIRILDGSTDEATSFGAMMVGSKRLLRNTLTISVIILTLAKVWNQLIFTEHLLMLLPSTGWMNEHGVRISMTHRRLPDSVSRPPKGVLKNNYSPINF